MPPVKPTLSDSVKKQIAVTLVTILIPSLFAFMGWVAKSYADQNYVNIRQYEVGELKRDQQYTKGAVNRDLANIERDIVDIDDQLFEIGQELQFLPPGSPEIPKWDARRDYYQRQKDGLLREREAKLQELGNLP